MMAGALTSSSIFLRSLAMCWSRVRLLGYLHPRCPDRDTGAVPVASTFRDNRSTDPASGHGILIDAAHPDWSQQNYNVRTIVSGSSFRGNCVQLESRMPSAPADGNKLEVHSQPGQLEATTGAIRLGPGPLSTAHWHRGSDTLPLPVAVPPSGCGTAPRSHAFVSATTCDASGACE